MVVVAVVVVEVMLEVLKTCNPERNDRFFIPHQQVWACAVKHAEKLKCLFVCAVVLLGSFFLSCSLNTLATNLLMSEFYVSQHPHHQVRVTDSTHCYEELQCKIRS